MNEVVDLLEYDRIVKLSFDYYEIIRDFNEYNYVLIINL